MKYRNSLTGIESEVNARACDHSKPCLACVSGKDALVDVPETDYCQWHKEVAYREQAEHELDLALTTVFRQFEMRLEGELVIKHALERHGLFLRDRGPWELEVNGPANIIMHLRDCQRLGKPVDLAFIEKQASMSCRYIQSKNSNHAHKWHDTLAEESYADRRAAQS